MAPTASPHAVVFVVFDGMQLLDLAGPADVFRVASLIGAAPAYEITTASVDGQLVRADNGITISPDTSLTALRQSRRRIDTLVVVGGVGVDAVIADGRVARLLAELAPRATRIASVCSGALVLAAAGLLDGYRATTHWASCDDLAQRHPDVDVVADRLHVHDRDRWTSAGVTAGIDLTLAVVEHDHGPELAHQLAGWLVVFVRRPGGQAQFSVQLLSQPARTPAIAELQAWLPDHLAHDLEVDALARHAAMSPRSFARAFRAETGTTPAAYVEALRVEAARRLLETSDLTVAAVAGAVGIRHAETLHRAFRRRVGTTPDQYRKHFQRRARLNQATDRSTPMQIAFALYPGFTALDFIGPYQVFSNLPGEQVVLCTAEPGIVSDDNGLLHLQVETGLDAVPAPDIVLVPGGPFASIDAAAASPLVDWLRTVHETTTWTTSVCTGALLLGAAGILEGRPATTHWLAYDRLAGCGASPTEQRVVIDGKVATAAGVSAGIDLGLTLVGKHWGDDVAQAIQLGIEYDPQPPYDSGSPSKAPTPIKELVAAIMAG